MKKTTCVLALLLMLVPVAQVAAQKQKQTLTEKSVERARKSVARMGVGSRAKATITLYDRTKVKGYIYSVGDDDFVVRDSKTDSPTTVRYADVMDVNDKSNNNLLIGLVAAGVGATIFAVVATRGGVLR